MNRDILGEPFTANLNTADASAGVAVPIFKNGTVAAYTLAANEYLEVHDVIAVSAPGGDIRIHFGTVADTTPADAKTIARGTVAATGGLGRGAIFNHVGLAGEGIFAIAPAGALDVAIKGTIRKEGATGVRPAYKEALFGR